MASPESIPAYRPMVYGSVCSGIEAATAAWHPLGWEPAFFSEIEAFPRAVLQHHYPHVPLHGDFTTIEAGQYGPIRLLVGGTPCQSFSVAGLRGGLADDRGNLALEYLRLADRLRPEWLVWENVPGVLSSNGGRDFGSILGGLVELRYGFAYGVLDAQHFGIPQRRRRVFVVGYLGDWRPAAAVLLERSSLQGNHPPRREAGEKPAGTLTSSLGRRGGTPNDDNPADYLIAGTLSANGKAAGSATSQDAEAGMLVSSTLRANTGRNQIDSTYLPVAHSLRAEGFDASEDGTGRGTPLVPVAFGWQNSPSQGDSVSERVFPSLDKSKTPAIAFQTRGSNLDTNGSLAGTIGSNADRASGGAPCIAFAQNSRSEVRQFGGDGQIVGALAADVGAQQQTYVAASAVRRLTPRECERLQGFPDHYTAVPYRGKPAADGPRYRALGNSMAVPVMRWIGDRIQAVESILSPMVR